MKPRLVVDGIVSLGWLTCITHLWLSTMPVSIMASSGIMSLYWEVFPSMPTCRVYCTPACQDGHLYVMGGCSKAGVPLDTVEMLDVLSQTWAVLPTLPTPRAGAAAVTVGKQVLVIGGMNYEQCPLATVEIYNSDEGKWEKKAPLCQPSMGISAIEKGGRQGKLPVTAFEALDLEVKSWTRYPSIPSRRAFASCTMTETSFFSLGGLQQPGPHNFYSRPHFVNTVEMFDSEQGIWSKPCRSTRMREKRADFVTGYLGGRVVVAGGLGNQPSPLSSVEGFNMVKKRWEFLPSMPTGRCSCSSIQSNNMLFVIGGVAQGPSCAVEALCVLEDV
ncbi:kelch domain-containing protein 8B isoform X3 [Dendrobates tinctorius]|uniref:kelch domain-containing protein 8B isoform X3 n=1 Tax=Dendrobates tinctorius TaxID=92724 RepID=UPI003CCA13CF